MERKKVKSVVVDAVAFFKNVPLQDFAEKVYTVRPVVNEIRDAKTRQRLAVLPYQLHFKEPSTDSIQHVSEFARKTGDFQSLSAVDVQVMALAFQMTKELIGTAHLKQEPVVKKTFSASARPLVKNTDIVGFYLPSKGKAPSAAGEGGVPLDLTELTVAGEERQTDNSESGEVPTESKDEDSSIHQGTPERDGADTSRRDDPPAVQSKEELLQNAENERRTMENSEPPKQQDQSGMTVDSRGKDQDGSEGEEEESEGEDEGGNAADDDVGWITPQNLEKAKSKMGTDIKDSLEGVSVACLTSDFAMQNVLIQMGIHVVSVEGMLIRRARSYALRCFACFKVTSDTSRSFCPKCGNATLEKVSVSVDEQGNTHYHMSKRRRYRAGDLRQSLSLPKGGKHADNPIVCEDQPRPQERVSRKAMMRNNVFDPDYVAQNSPFVTRDVTSRSAILGVAKKKQQNRRGRRK